jgi:hypothetical protein
MAVILHPKRWTNQPPAGAQINFGHPLARGMTAYILCNAAAGLQRALLPLNLPGNQIGTPSAARWKAEGTGTGHNFDGNWGMWWERGLWFEPPTNLSVVCRKRRTGTIANQDTRVSFKTFGNTGSSPFISYGLNNNPSSSAGQDNISFDIATGGAFHLGTVYNAGSGATQQEHTHAGTYTSGSLKLFYNGIQRANDNFNGSLSYDTTSTGRFLWSSNSALSLTVPYPGILYWTGVWNRVLTPSEMEWLHIEPYAMLVPQVQKKYFIPLVTARAFTYNVAAEKII